MTIKLNDPQRILLATASNREDGKLLPAPDSIADDTRRLNAAITSLIRRKLAVKTSDGVILTDIGRTAIRVEPPPVLSTTTEPAQADAAPAEPTPTGTGTKIGLLADLLASEGGATLDDLTNATGWLPHTVRAALSGLRKKGHVIDRDKRDDVTCYHLRAAAQ